MRRCVKAEQLQKRDTRKGGGGVKVIWGKGVEIPACGAIARRGAVLCDRRKVQRQSDMFKVATQQARGGGGGVLRST